MLHQAPIASSSSTGVRESAGAMYLQRILLLGFCVGRIFSDCGSSLFLANAYDDSDLLLGLEPFWAN